MDNKFISVAKCRKPQGIKGEIKVSVFLDNPNDFKNLTTLYYNSAECKVERIFCVGSDFAVKLEGINTAAEAQMLKDKYLYALRSDVEKFKANELYIADILNKNAVFETGEALGVIEDVQNFGATDVVYIASEKYKNLSFANVGGIIKNIEGDRVVLNRAEFNKVCVYDD